MLPKLSHRTLQLLSKSFDSPDTIFSMDEPQLKKAGINKTDAASIASASSLDVSSVIRSCRAEGISIITYVDFEYPERLKNIYAPPPVLYIKGVLPDVDEYPVISVIGTRRADAYGIKAAYRFGCDIVRCGGITVSLLTKGIDAAAAEGALSSGGRFIAVLGTSHDKADKKQLSSLGSSCAVISEYPPSTGTDRSFFRARNRIAAGLSTGVVVIQAPLKSGTRFFVNEAAEQGKDIFALPGNADSPNSEGIIQLLKDGAKPVSCGWDILSEYLCIFPDRVHPAEASFEPPDTVQVKPAPSDWRSKAEKLNETQIRILETIEAGSCTSDDIIATSALSAATVLSQLTMLEIKGFIRREPGNLFRLKNI